MTVVLSGIKEQGLMEAGLGRGKSLLGTTTEASETPRDHSRIVLSGERVRA